MANVVFIEPSIPFNGYWRWGFPLMGPLILGTILKEAGHEVLILRDSIRSVYGRGKNSLNDTLTKADVVAISAMTSTANRAYEIADAVRRAAPKAKVIIGGSHPTYMPEEALEHADLVVRGEGEEVILDAVNDRNLTGIIQGTQVKDLNKLPFPDFSILSDQDRLPIAAPIYTSRGCPYDCVFCTVSSTFGRKYRSRDPESVLEEINMRASQEYQSFFFYDDNFGDNKEKTKILLDKLVHQGINIRWAAEARADIVKDRELLELMSRTNCWYLLIGFESINPQSLAFYKKRQTVEDIKRCIMQLHEHNIKVHGMFAFGSDADDSNTVKDTVKFCHEMKLDSAQFAILHPLPGSRLYDILNSGSRIFTRDWSLYDGTHVVFKPRNMHPLELQEKFLWAFKKFYSLRRSLPQFLACRYVLNKWCKANRKALADLKRYFGTTTDQKAID